MRLFAMMAAVMAVMVTSFAPVTAQAETMSWSVQSNHPNRVQLEFYSQTYSQAWPGNGNAYVLDDYSTKSVTLSCTWGEKICYGAWVDGDSDTYWGVGINDSQSCSNCCYTCGEGNPNITLNP